MLTQAADRSPAHTAPASLPLEAVFKTIRWKIPAVPILNWPFCKSTLFLDSVRCHHDKGKEFSKNDYYEKEKGRPYSFAQLMYKFEISHIAHYWLCKKNNTKGTSFQPLKKPTAPPPTSPEKGVDSQKVSGSSKTVFMKKVKKSRLSGWTLSHISLFWIQAQDFMLSLTKVHPVGLKDRLFT
jgi:hypothetical protein